VCVCVVCGNLGQWNQKGGEAGHVQGMVHGPGLGLVVIRHNQSMLGFWGLWGCMSWGKVLGGAVPGSREFVGCGEPGTNQRRGPTRKGLGRMA